MGVVVVVIVVVVLFHFSVYEKKVNTGAVNNFYGTFIVREIKLVSTILSGCVFYSHILLFCLMLKTNADIARNDATHKNKYFFTYYYTKFVNFGVIC